MKGGPFCQVSPASCGDTSQINREGLFTCNYISSSIAEETYFDDENNVQEQHG